MKYRAENLTAQSCDDGGWLQLLPETAMRALEDFWILRKFKAMSGTSIGSLQVHPRRFLYGLNGKRRATKMRVPKINEISLTDARDLQNWFQSGWYIELCEFAEVPPDRFVRCMFGKRRRDLKTAKRFNHTTKGAELLRRRYSHAIAGAAKAIKSHWHIHPELHASCRPEIHRKTSTPRKAP